MEGFLSFIIDDIIWFDSIVEKLSWKHAVLPREVEEVLTGKCRIFRKESGKALIITARDMNKRERRRYGKK